MATPEELLAILRELVTPAVWRRIIVATIKRAQKGDISAIDWLARRVPVDTVRRLLRQENGGRADE